LSKGAKAALGEVSPQAQQGAEEQVYLFWHGRVEDANCLIKKVTLRSNVASK